MNLEEIVLKQQKQIDHLTNVLQRSIAAQTTLATRLNNLEKDTAQWAVTVAEKFRSDTEDVLVPISSVIYKWIEEVDYLRDLAKYALAVEKQPKKEEQAKTFLKLVK